ncbi:hybrid sensor histidine kinase/response regulator [Ghiorsea bivora]|uniref:hybrid sensor histidine kinase/response regulator n=1 Tax=Ghiorsea bivora TaxID=1485545 RepID=UPI00068CAB73|nr:ATP-binding protein [Ghiorsea bivora]
MPVLPRSISLNKAWYALIFVASLLPAFIIAPWLADQAHKLLLERALLQEKIYHKQIEVLFYEETKRLISVLVNKADPIALHLDNPKTFNANINNMTTRLLHRLMKREPMFNTISLYDNHANIITRVKRNQHTPALITTQSPAFIISQHNRTFIGSPHRLADGHFEFIIAVPLIAHEQVIGSVIATINILDFWRNIQTKVTTTEDNMLYLIDGRGVLLAHEQNSHLHQGDLLTNKAIVRSLLAYKNWNSTQAYQGFEQQNVFGIGSHINNLSWSIVSEISASRIMQPIEKSLSYLVFIVFLVHIFFGVFGILMVRRMLQPIHSLSQAIQHAEQGQYQVDLPHSAYKEVQNLIQHFTNLTHTIAERESELRQYMRTLEHLGESILITDKHGIVSYINPAFKKDTSYTNSILGKPIQHIKKSTQSNTVYHRIHHCIQTGEAWEGRVTAFKADGESFPARIHISPVFSDHHITHFVMILQNMTKHDLLEAQLLQAQKTESIGTLVGGIAHDFNNNLAAIMGNTYLAKASIKAGRDQDTTQKIENIESLSKHAATVVAQLMAYARQDIIQKDKINLSTTIENTIGLSHVAIPENIQFKVHITHSDDIVFADPSQIQQMVMNLLNNARDAVATVEQPCITLHVTPVFVDANFHKRNPDISTLHFMRLSIKDNGHGITKENLPHIFDPFFTTKAVGEGTGLGLSMILGMVQSHQGVIDVESTQDKGTTFHIYLPIVENKQNKIHNINEPQHEHAQGESILLIDDDDEVRETTAEVLESLGYQVIQASDGLQGLQCFEQAIHISAIIVDLIMPNMGGIAFAERIRQSHENIGIIFLTGYEKPDVLHKLTIQNTCILSKPIDFDLLHQTIQHMFNVTQKLK